MTEEESKAWKKAKEYFVDIYENINNIIDEELAIKCTYKQAYLEGLHEGQPKWHDLRKDPNDLPKVEGEYLICYQTGVGYKNTFILKWDINDDDEYHWYDDEYETYDEGVIAWCEKPIFKE